MKKWEYLKGAKKEKRVRKDGSVFHYTEGGIPFPEDLKQPARTIITSEGGQTPSRFKHVIEQRGKLRRLTPVELERANMFPDNHTKLSTDTKIAFFMGNALVVGIILGFFTNILGINLANTIQASIDMITAVALPAALFGMGGVLYQYRPEGDIGPIVMICLVSLLIHPTVVWFTGSGSGLTDAQMRSAVITAAMAPGINTYVFANIYRKAKRVASTGVLLSTALSIGTVWVWLNLFP